MTAWYINYSATENELLEKNIIARLPSGDGFYDRDESWEAIGDFIALGHKSNEQTYLLYLKKYLS